jgi:Diacylglycerol kinase catalytic domain/Diacylglycerol kinase accessory domain
MTDTVSSPRENGNAIHTKDHVTMQNGDAPLEEMNEKNKQQYQQKKSKTLNRESSYGEIHEQGPEAFFEADNNANENPAPIPHLQQVPRGDSFDESQEKLNDGNVGKSWRTDSRPGYSNKIYTSVMLEDSEHEGRPSVYLFIFVNPLSGDQKGQELTRMAIQSFRLKEAPEVQVQIYNILDDKDRELGFEMLKLVEGMAERDELMPVPENSKIGTTARRRQIHVWSAGGDGTVMSVFEELVSHKVNLDIVYFSCKQLMKFYCNVLMTGQCVFNPSSSSGIPFGTGNDFSQVLGWGRTIPNKDILGTYLNHLVDLSLQRLQGEAARLDIWELEIATHDSGYARKAGKKHRDDNSKIVTRKMCNYMSIGVQGYVGSGFENQRTGTREFNVLVYAYESAKWMRRGFPPVTKMIEGMTQGGKKVLRCRYPNKKGVSKTAVEDEPEQDGENVPVMTKHPIDFVIQNIPHIW